MIVAAHQPHYLPWLGYLDKLAKADVFVVMDDLQYEAQNFQNRNRVKLNHGPHVAHGAAAARHAERLGSATSGSTTRRAAAATTGSTATGARSRRTTAARRSSRTTPTSSRTCSRAAGTSLVDLDLHMLELARNWLRHQGADRPRDRRWACAGQKTDRILDTCRTVGARAYLSGARRLDRVPRRRRVRARRASALVWQQFHHPQYPQRYPGCGFVSHLGFLDLLFNCGPDAAAILWPRTRRRPPPKDPCHESPARRERWPRARVRSAPR